MKLYKIHSERAKYWNVTWQYLQRATSAQLDKMRDFVCQNLSLKKKKKKKNWTHNKNINLTMTITKIQRNTYPYTIGKLDARKI